MKLRRCQPIYATAAIALSFAAAIFCAAWFARGQETSGEKVMPSPNGIYIVELAEKPVVTYDGGIPGYPATRAAEGQRPDPNDINVRRYSDYLDSRHDAVVKSVGGRKIAGYRYTFNGFAAKLTLQQTRMLLSIPGVVRVTPDRLRKSNISLPQADTKK